MTAVPFLVLAGWALLAAIAPVPRRAGALLSPPVHIRAGEPWRSVPARLAGWRRRRRAETGLPEAVDAVAAAVGAGRSVVDGLAVAAAESSPALAAELHQVVVAVGRGLPVLVAVERWVERSTVDGAPLVAAAIGLAGDAGGDVEHALAGVAATLRERRALTREIRALSSQARASAVTIAVAPLAFGALAVAADGETAHFLFGSTAGLACLGVGLVLDLVGFRWMGRLAGRIR